VPDAATAAPPRLDWIDRCLQRRDAILASPAFRRWAAAFVPTRVVARRRARALFDLVAGFAYSQVLLACVRLDLFETLFERPQTLSEIARRCALDATAARRLLDAAVSLRLLELRRHARYGLGPLGAAMVGNDAVKAMVEHHDAFYDDLADPLALLRSEARATRLSRYWAYADAAQPSALDDSQVAAYSALMSASQPLVADEILRAYPMTGHRRLLDVGGGEGAFLAAALTRAPALRGELFDLPAVARRAELRWRDTPLATRMRAVGGDFLADDLPRGADVATLVRVLHDHDDASVLTVLRAVHAALAPGGTLLVAEPMAGTPGAEPMGDAYFGLYLYAMGSGRPRTAHALEALLRCAGFAYVRPLRTAMPLQTGLLRARKSTSA